MLLSWLPWIFWFVAIVASILYGVFSVAIFVRPKGRPPTPWLWHQRWFNFLGSLLGWLASWALIRRHCDWLIATCTGPVDVWDLVGIFIAFLGMAGYMPYTMLGIATGLKLLGLKAVGRYIPKE